MRRNALLAKPPHATHRLDGGGEGFARHILGRRVTAADYEGVHTTSDLTIAAAYAMSAWAKRRDENAYPVILTLDTTGLTPLPDVDALVQGYMHMQNIQKELREALQEHDDLNEIVNKFSQWDGAFDPEGGLGDDPAVFVFEHVAGEPVSSFVDALRETGLDDNEIVTALRAWTERDEMPEQALTTIVKQRRYMADFDLDRIVAIDAMRPWWPETFDDWWDSEEGEDGEVGQQAARIQAAGWKLWTMEDAAHGLDVGDRKRLFEKPGENGGEYHGTISSAIRAAFPDADLIPVDGPFPVEEVD